MSDQTTPRSYANLDMVRRHLEWDDVDSDRDGDVLLIAQAVTERIEHGIGVAWNGGEPTERTRSVNYDALDFRLLDWRAGAERRSAFIGETVRLPFPLLSVSAITVDGLTVEVTDYPPTGYDGQRGWYQGLILRRSFLAGQTLEVTGTWADDPGGNPPPRVVLFASLATAQDWRRMSAGGSRTVYPDGTAVSISDAWDPKGPWGDLVRDFGLPAYKARVR